MSNETSRPTLAEVLTRAIDARLVDVHTSIPGRVTKYDAATRRADVEPLIKLRHRDEEDNAIATALPVMPNVPVEFPGSSACEITFEIQPGDLVILLFAEASLDRWKQIGGLVDPGDDRRFHLSDAIAIPVREHRSATAASAGIHLRANGEIWIGGVNLTDSLALASKVDARLQELAAVFAAWVPAPGDGGALLKTLLTNLMTLPPPAGSNWPQGTGSTTLKGK